MMVLDDSGSMAYRHLPESVFAGGTYATSNPVGGATVRWDATDDFQYSLFTRGTVPGLIGSTNYVLKALRSSDTNTMFYNPETRYLPWVKSDGTTRYDNAPIFVAYKNPANTSTGGVVDLTNVRTIASGGAEKYCYAGSSVAAADGVGCATLGSSIIHDPGVYFRLQTEVIAATAMVVGKIYTIVSVGTTNFAALGAKSNTIGVSFTATAAGTGTGTVRGFKAVNIQTNYDAYTVNSTLQTAGSLTIGRRYLITSLGNTNFSLVGAVPLNATAMVKGTAYIISSVGTTTFTNFGASANTVGTRFVATAAGSGTGVVLPAYFTATGVGSGTGTAMPLNKTYAKVAARTDCSGAIGTTGCTQEQEQQNFANWFSYYRTRNLLARGSVMESFAPIGNTIRVGFGSLNKTSASVDGVNTTVIESNTATYGGGGVRAFTQSRKDQLFKWLFDGAWFCSNCTTPLPAALNAIGTYYQRQDNRGPYTDDPSTTNTVANNKTCRRSYQMMVTDGYWNGTPPTVGNQDAEAGTKIDGNYIFQANTKPYADSYSNTLADVAMKYWKADLQPNISNKIEASSADPTYWQNMTNYMVGLGVRGELDPDVDLPLLISGDKNWKQPTTAVSPVSAANIDDLWHAAINSRGAYYSAKDPVTLANAVSNSLAGAQGGSGTTAGVATISSVLQNGNRKYVPSYNGGVWSGDISAQPLDGNGQTTTAAWSAADRLPDAADRKIYTWDTAPLAAPSTPAGVAFDWSLLSLSNKAAMTSGSQNLINFLRGDHSNEYSLATPSNTYRERKNAAGQAFVLGDFINSNPVLVKGLVDGAYGALNLGGTNGYQIFTAAKATRDGVLFAGSNDGMLHGFIDANKTSTVSSDGREVFAYVPRAVYPDLYRLSDRNYGSSSVPHKLFVDGPLREFDAYVAGPAYAAFGSQPACASGATCWRNFLVGSLGSGGRAVYALDVTSSPNLGASNIRWEISSSTDTDLGYVLAPIEVGVLPNGKWVAVFGNGFSSDNEKAILFIVDLETSSITKITVDSSGSNGLGGVSVVRNTAGQITTLYAGDLKGKLWKLEYNTSTSTFAVSGGAAIFTASGPGGGTQAITQPPSIFSHSKGGNLLVFGTGRLFTDADKSSTDTQTVYGVWDKPSDTETRPLTRSKLVSRTLTGQAGTGAASTSTFYTLTGNTVDWDTKRGWYIDLSPAIPGGRVIYPSQSVSSSLVLVTAVAPPQSSAVCEPSAGTGADLVFQVESGAQSSDPTFDTNGDGVVNTSDTRVAGIQTNSVGTRALIRGVGGGAICSSGFMPVSVQNATGQTMVCVPEPPVVPVVTNAGIRILKRIERRIINPPIR